MIYDALLDHPAEYSLMYWMVLPNFSDPRVAFLFGMISVCAIQGGLGTLILKGLQLFLPTSMFVPIFFAVAIIKLVVKTSSRKISDAIKEFSASAFKSKHTISTISTTSTTSTPTTHLDAPVGNMRRPRNQDVPTSSLIKQNNNNDLVNAVAEDSNAAENAENANAEDSNAEDAKDAGAEDAGAEDAEDANSDAENAEDAVAEDSSAAEAADYSKKTSKI